MVGCYLHLLNVGQFAQFFDQLGLKVTVLVCQQFFRKPLTCGKFVPESRCCCFSSLVGGCNGLCISCEVVCYDQNVHIGARMGIFYCQKSPYGPALEDKLLVMGKALPYPPTF